MIEKRSRPTFPNTSSKTVRTAGGDRGACYHCGFAQGFCRSASGFFPSEKHWSDSAHDYHRWGSFHNVRWPKHLRGVPGDLRWTHAEKPGILRTERDENGGLRPL